MRTPTNQKMDEMSYDPGSSKRLLDPVERISEILFGLIMALTFTCTLSVAESDQEDIRSMLVSAIGCNIAWGVVDAVMYILSLMTYRGHNTRILRFIANSKDPQRSREHIGGALPPLITSVLSEQQLEEIRTQLLQLPAEKTKQSLSWTDFKTALGIFLLVFLSTLPVAIPFMFIHQPHLALRVSNLIAVVLMFMCGWFLAGFGGYNKILMALSLTLLGVCLVGLTIVLGG